MVKKTKKSPEKKAENDALRKEIGKRFREFRKSLYLAQHQLALELDVFQSTITNLELGKTFPNCIYLYHFYKKYDLNIHWLLTGKGKKFIQPHPKTPGGLPNFAATVIYGESTYKDYLELLKHMKIPKIERAILGTLSESKIALKDKIKELL